MAGCCTSDLRLPLSGGLHTQRLMRTPVVVKADLVRDYTAGVLQGLESVAVHALVLERSDHALDHAVLPWAVRGDELLLQAIDFDQGRVAAAGEHQSVV
jgi:hypothetical protein